MAKPKIKEDEKEVKDILSPEDSEDIQGDSVEGDETDVKNKDDATEDVDVPGDTGGAPDSDIGGMPGGAPSPDEPAGKDIINQEKAEEAPAISAEAKKGGSVLRSGFLASTKKEPGDLTADDIMVYLSNSEDFNIENTDENRHKILGELSFMETDRTVAELENKVGKDDFWGAIFKNASAITTSSSEKDVTEIAEAYTAAIMKAILEKL